MDIVSALLLALSVSLSAVKNTLIKGFSGFSIKGREFFGIQSVIFGFGSIALLFVNIFDFNGISQFTILLALLYGIILLCAQWFYTIALTNGKTAICATIYSFGFIFPTLSGSIVWNESLTVFGILGILTVFPVLIISGMGSKKSNNESSSKKYIIPLVIALICSGALGIVQKVQQKSEFANQRSTFILIAFVFSFVASLLFYLIKKPSDKKITFKNFGFSSIVGITFAICNLLNTYLAGKLDSAIFFPALNIGIILTSVIAGLIVYKERLSKKDIIIMLLGVLAIVLVNF